MNKKAFKLSKDSDLHKKYFESDNAKQDAHVLARKFFAENKLEEEKGQYIFTDQLSMSMSNELYQKHKPNLLSKQTYGNLYSFKKNSEMNKKWLEEVYDKADVHTMRQNKFWYFDYIGGTGKYALWDYNGEVYGYLESDCEITLPDGATEIKMSEYYAIIEESEEKEN